MSLSPAPHALRFRISAEMVRVDRAGHGGENFKARVIVIVASISNDEQELLLSRVSDTHG